MEHPEFPEQPGKVRADVKLACYLAQPLHLEHFKEGCSSEEQKKKKVDTTMNGVVVESSSSNNSRRLNTWSRVFMFSEIGKLFVLSICFQCD